MTAKTLSVLLILLALRPAAAEDTSSGRLELSAEPPVIAVSASAPGRQFVELPTLQYRFVVQTACADGRTPRSLSINVADSRLALSGPALESEPGELLLTIPARQLAPIAVDDFCVVETVADDEATEAGAPGNLLAIAPAAAGHEPRRLLRVPAVISVQASLVCADESGDAITYVTQPLGVTLECAAPVESGSGNPSDTP